MDRPTYLKVNTEAIKRNIEKIKAKYNNYNYFIAVVKADCYHHGINLAIKAMKEAGCNYFAVATLEEALDLRTLIEEPILILEPILKENIKIAVEKNFTITVDNLEYLENINDPVKVHIKVDTGMNRLGFKDKEEIKKAYDKIQDSNLLLEGIYTHIYEPSNEKNTKKQVEKFEELTKEIPLSTIPIVHLFASEAMKKYEKKDYINGCRLGKNMYGFEVDESLELESTFALVSHIIEIKTLEIGETLGYDGTFVAEEKTRIGILPIGYADGLLRKNKGRDVIINEKHYPIVGNICMDMCFIKLDEEAKVGEKVYLLKDKNHIEEVAKYLETIPLEVCCTISSRVPRI